MRFEWDVGKARRNLKKHGIVFDHAITAFDDPFALIAFDDMHSGLEEIREWLIGESDKGVLVVVYTMREREEICRIIGARRANRQERIRYEEYKRVSL
jgi:uncharacterized protein